MVIIGSYEKEKNIIENISLTGSYCIIQIAIKLSVCVNQRNLKDKSECLPLAWSD